MESISGRDSSGLALLAQCNGLTADERARVLAKLSPLARKIGLVLLGGRGPKCAVVAADYFRQWASELTQPRNELTARHSA